jgi:hypothetical protein
MTRDVIGFAPDRQSSYASSVETIQAEIVQTLPYANAYSKQLQPRRDDNLRWIALAVIAGAVVALAFMNFLIR